MSLRRYLLLLLRLRVLRLHRDLLGYWEWLRCHWSGLMGNGEQLFRCWLLLVLLLMLLLLLLVLLLLLLLLMLLLLLLLLLLLMLVLIMEGGRKIRGAIGNAEIEAVFW